MTDFPVAVVRHGEDWLAEPLGPDATFRVLDAIWSDTELPAGFRVEWADPMAFERTERPVGVDQTHRSVIVGERIVVKWTTTPLAGPHPATERVGRLVAAGFTGTPRVRGVLEWRTPDQSWVPVAAVTDFRPGAEDGWTWCLREARIALGVTEGPARPFATELGDLIGRMHLALADGPTGPVADHGDLHVGQILRDADGLWVIDFDGNPTLPPEERMAHRPAAYDVAGMLLSLENVGHVVRKYHPEVPDSEVIAWTEATQGEFLAGYRGVAGHLLDESLLGPYIDQQIQRELDYAEAHLPAWRYVPEAALRRRNR